jgi:hypothetical protein
MKTMLTGQTEVSDVSTTIGQRSIRMTQMVLIGQVILNMGAMTVRVALLTKMLRRVARCF